MKTLLLLLVSYLSHFLLHAQNFKILAQLTLNDNSSISSLRFDRNEYGVGILNDKGVMAKVKPLPSIPLHLGTMGDDIVVIGADVKNIKTIGYNAILLNKKSLSVLQTRNLFSKNNSNRISSVLLKDPFNNFCYVLFRETKYDEGFSFFGPSIYDTKYLESSSIQLVSLNNKFEPKNIDIKTEAAGSYFAGACADDVRNVYICSFTDNNIMVEKFDSTGKLLGKLSSPFTVWKNPNLDFIMKNDRDNQSCITIAATCQSGGKKMSYHAIRFDFTNNKIFNTGEIILNKEYRQSLKSATEEAKGRNFADIDNLKPVQILEDANRVIVVKEIINYQLGNKGEATTYFREGSIISVYNKKNFEVERDIVIDKRMATFVEQSYGIFARLADNYLWAITCESSGLGAYKTYVYKINLATGEVTKDEIQKEGIGKGWVTFAGQTAWFKKNFVVPFFKVSSPFSLSFESAFIAKPY
jgi:hypothetical protein